MAEEQKQEIQHKRQDLDQPMVLPGIHRYQFFTNLKDRGWTRNLDRVALFGIVGALLATIIKPLMRGNPATIYCYECRACYATQDRCPVGITFQAELAVAAGSATTTGLSGTAVSSVYAAGIVRASACSTCRFRRCSRPCRKTRGGHVQRDRVSPFAPKRFGAGISRKGIHR